MASTTAVCNSYKQEVLQGIHLSTDSYKVALYNPGTLDKTTTAYTSTGEVSGAGYVAGGTALTGFTVGISGDVAYVDFADVSWPSATFSASTALVYNSTRGNKAVAVVTFAITTCTAANWTLSFPAPGATAVVTLG